VEENGEKQKEKREMEQEVGGHSHTPTKRRTTAR
jgi:hypothetical protein